MAIIDQGPVDRYGALECHEENSANNPSDDRQEKNSVGNEQLALKVVYRAEEQTNRDFRTAVCEDGQDKGRIVKLQATNMSAEGLPWNSKKQK